MTKQAFARDFKARWEGEIRDQIDLGQADSAISFWDNAIAAKVDDGDLPAAALKWNPPAWLVRLERLASQNEGSL